MEDLRSVCCCAKKNNGFKLDRNPREGGNEVDMTGKGLSIGGSHVNMQSGKSFKDKWAQ